MKTFRPILATVLICFSIAAAHGNIIPVVNGSFESPLAGGSFLTYNGPNNNTSLLGWTINGSIDHIGGYWQAADGAQSLDMNGNFAGSVEQLIALPGGLTQVHFSMAGNPDNGADIKFLEVSLLFAGGSQTFTFDTSGATHANMNWVAKTADFGNLPAGNYTLRFSGFVSDGPYGPALDNVSVTVPDGGLTAMLLGMGILSLRTLRRMVK